MSPAAARGRSRGRAPEPGRAEGGGRVGPRRGLVRAELLCVHDGVVEGRTDALAAEEPLEIRLLLPGRSEALRLAVTMRTPGSDFELVAGFLHTEGVVSCREDIASLGYCARGPAEQRYNVVQVVLAPGAACDPARLVRHFYTTSSCGVCGKASLEAVRAQGLRRVDPPPRLGADLVLRLPEALRRGQALFERTGGLHGAALFDPSGEPLVVREDVGRHNAVDKVVGERLLAGALPARTGTLLISGRASFEIVQKALVAGIPAVCAVSAPSSLAVDLAREFGMVLIGFLRGGRFNVYAGAEHLGLGPEGAPAVAPAGSLPPPPAP